MINNRLLNPKNFVIDEDCCEDAEKGIAACKRLIEKWTPELETLMLDAFIKLYYDEMYKQWGLIARKKVKSIGRKSNHLQTL